MYLNEINSKVTLPSLSFNSRCILFLGFLASNVFELEILYFISYLASFGGKEVVLIKNDMLLHNVASECLASSFPTVKLYTILLLNWPFLGVLINLKHPQCWHFQVKYILQKSDFLYANLN